MNKPQALLIYPPVHDFALYDLYLKPFGLLRIARLLEIAGWSWRMVNALDYQNKENIKLLGNVKRYSNGTGKFHRQTIELPPALKGIDRRFARYGTTAEVLKAEIAAERPDAVFIATGMTYWYRGVMEAVETVRECWPQAPVILGGIYSSLMPEHCLDSCGPDFICTGGVEAAGSNISPPGLSGGRIDARFESKTKIGNFAELDRFLGEKGLPGIISGMQGALLPADSGCWRDAAVIRLNEGCPLNCDYCASKTISPCFIPGNPESVLEWIQQIHEKHNTKNFAFYDDALLVGADRVFKPFLKMVIDYQQKTGVSFNFYTPNAMHIRFIDKESAVLMEKAGFREIRLGFESESEDFHEAYDGKYSSYSFHRSIDLLTSAGFSRSQIVVYILAGLPGQYASEVEETIRYAAGEKLTLSVSEFSTVPGSQLWEDCVRQSRYPVAEEPLYHNNSFFPMEWDGFTRGDMQRLKMLSKHL